MVDHDVYYNWTGSMEENFGGNHVANIEYKDQTFPLSHEGHASWTTDNLLENTRDRGSTGKGNIRDWINDYTCHPTCTLIHLGTNDCFRKDTVTSTVAQLAQLIDVLKDNFNTTILLAVPIRSCLELVDQYATFIPTLADPSRRVFIVRQDTEDDGFPMVYREDLFDTVHPNSNGEKKMAAKWFAAMAKHCLPEGTVPYLDSPVTSTTTPFDESISRSVLEDADCFLEVGDPIRQVGVGANMSSWRSYLWRDMVTSGIQLGTVDGLVSGSIQSDATHAGLNVEWYTRRPGYMDILVDSNMPVWPEASRAGDESEMNSCRPMCAIIQVGTDEACSSRAASSTLAALDAMISAVQKSTDSTVLLATPMWTQCCGTGPFLASMIPALLRGRKRVYIVDMPDGLDDDLSEGDGQNSEVGVDVTSEGAACASTLQRDEKLAAHLWLAIERHCILQVPDTTTTAGATTLGTTTVPDIVTATTSTPDSDLAGDVLTTTTSAVDGSLIGNEDGSAWPAQGFPGFILVTIFLLRRLYFGNCFYSD